MDFLKRECFICHTLNEASFTGDFNVCQVNCCGACFCTSCRDIMLSDADTKKITWCCPICFAPRAKSDKEDFYRAVKIVKEQNEIWAADKVGDYYFYGIQGLPQCYEKAFEYYSLAASQGYANAQNTIGDMYRLGQGVKQSDALAFLFYSLAADQNLPIALCSVGNCYYNGMGVEKSNEKGYEYMLRAADSNNVVAQYNVAIMHDQGWGVDGKDDEKALIYYTKAAERGHTDSAKKLAECYTDGSGGVKKSLVKAIYWYKQYVKTCKNQSLIKKSVEKINSLLEESLSSCANCGFAHRFMLTRTCSRCSCVSFCNSECQIKYWKEIHKSECKKDE